MEQQRYLTIAREFSQAGDRMDDLRRETTQQLGANREGIEQRLDKVRETVDAQLGAIRKDNNVQLDQMRATVAAPIHFDVASKYYVICLRHLLC